MEAKAIMRQQFRLILIFALIAGALAYALPQSSQDGVVEFTLTVAGSSVPLPGGTIVLLGPITADSSRGPYTQPLPQTPATTDKNGCATLRNLSPGRYLVSIQKEGYLVSQPAGKAAFNTSVIIEPGKSPQKIVVGFTRGASISGKILDSNGAPVVGANVATAVLTYKNSRRMLEMRGAAHTDDLGNYRLFWFGPGEYYIIATWPDSMASMKPNFYSMSYYPGTIDITKAKTVTIRDDKESTGINFALQEGKLRRVRGRVLIPERASINGQTEFRLENFAYAPSDPNAPEMPTGTS
jgi:sarcosine oxidase gamma subunit